MNDEQKTKQRRPLLFLIIIGSIVLLAVSSVFREQNAGPIIMGLIFGGFALFLAVGAGRQMLTNYRVGKPQVMLSHETAVLGDTINIDFDNTFNRSIDIDRITGSLIFKETATYQQGTDTRTVHHDHLIDSRETMGGHFQSGSFVSERYEFQIPRDGMHTLKVRRNSLRWLFIIEMHIDKAPNFKKEYEIQVLPQLSAADGYL